MVPRVPLMTSMSSAASTFTVAAGATLDMAAGGATVAYQGSFTGSGAGVVRVGTGILRLGGNVTFNFPAGLLHWNSSGTIDTNSTAASLKTLTNVGVMTIDGTAYLYGNGTLSNAGTIVGASGGALGFNSSAARAAS